MSTETFAVAIVGETDAGWFVEAESSSAAVDHVHAHTRARVCWRGELLVWNEGYYRERYLLGGPFPSGWTKLCVAACNHRAFCSQTSEDSAQIICE